MMSSVPGEQPSDTKSPTKGAAISYLFDKTTLLNNPKRPTEFRFAQNTKIAPLCILKTPTNVLISYSVIGPSSIIRADLGQLNINQYSIICDEVILHPPMTRSLDFANIMIGKYTIIGSKSVIKAYMIGNCVRIGRNCILEDNVIVNDNSIILDNSIVPADTNIPAGTIYGGKPAQFVGFVPSSVVVDHVLEAISYYNSLVSASSK